MTVADKQAAETMKNDIATAQAYVVEQEHICSLDNPPVIREYLTASEEDRAIFEVLLKTYKTNTVLKAKEAWYEWKRGFLEMVRPDVEAILVGMQMVCPTTNLTAIMAVVLTVRTRNDSRAWKSRRMSFCQNSKLVSRRWRRKFTGSEWLWARLQSVTKMSWPTSKLPLLSRRE